jgi:transposase
MTYSNDLRERVVLYVESGGSRISASKLFNIGERTVRKWMKLKASTGDIKPLPHAGGRRSSYTFSELSEYLRSNTDATLADCGEHFGVSQFSIWSCLRKNNYVYKKNTSISGAQRRSKAGVSG